MRYSILLRKTAPQCNAEEVTITLEADDEAAAREEAQRFLDLDAEVSPGLAWSNIGNLDLWNLPVSREIVSIQ